MSDFEELGRHTNMPIYFAHPYHSWERGSNENFNRLLRQFFSKQRNFKSINKVTFLNAKPRKRHVYASPVELLKSYLDVAI